MQIVLLTYLQESHSKWRKKTSYWLVCELSTLTYLPILQRIKSKTLGL